jgi:hypothetical protein
MTEVINNQIINNDNMSPDSIAQKNNTDLTSKQSTINNISADKVDTPTEKTEPEVKNAPSQQGIEQEGMGHSSSSRESSDHPADSEQDKLNKEAAAAAAEAKKKILDRIKELDKAIDTKARELSIKYNEAKGDEEKQESIEDELEAFSARAKDEINDLYSQLAEDSEPFFVKGFSILWELIKLKFKVIVDKMKLEPDVKETQLKMVEIVKKNIEDIEKNDGTLDIKHAQEVSNLLVSLESSISQSTSGSGGGGDGGGGAPGGALPPLPPGAAAAAAKALGKEEVEKEVEKEPEEKEEEKEPEAEEGGGDDGGGDGDGDGDSGEQEGGGISRKRSHPKYINQISENRNKIFKKELEIINSIRRFRRSHTIRKRDKINSVLGVRKSRNNKNRNHGNTKHTRRHMHRHQNRNNKHKSTKHIKK